MEEVIIALTNNYFFIFPEGVNTVSRVRRDRKQCEKRVAAVIAKVRAEDRKRSKSRGKTGGGIRTEDTDNDGEEAELRQLVYIYMGVDSVEGNN